MNIQVEQTNTYLRKLSISLPAAQVDAALGRAFRKVSKSVDIPGFRPGKVPRSLIERQHGPKILYEAQTELVEQSLDAAIKELQLEPIGEPKLECGSLLAGTDFIYTAYVEIVPEIVLQQYTELPVPDAVVHIDNQEIDAALARMLHEHAEIVPVESRNVVELGDLVLVDYDGYVDDVAVPTLEERNALVDTKQHAIPALAEALIGQHVPGALDVSVDMASLSGNHTHAGQIVVLKTTLKELKSRILPALDDDFAKDCGEDSLVALRMKAAEKLQTDKQKQQETAQERAVLQALIDKNPFELPPSILEQQLDAIVSNQLAELEQSMGQKLHLSKEQLQHFRNTKYDEAEFVSRVHLLLGEVAKSCSIVVTENDIATEIDTLIQQYELYAAQIRVMYDDPQRRAWLGRQIQDKRSIKHLLSVASVTPSV